MTALMMTLLVKASVIMAGTGAIALMCRRASAAKRHLIWTVSVLALLALPVFTFILPSLNIPVAASTPVSRMAAAAGGIDEAVALRFTRQPSANPVQSDVAAETSKTAPQPLPWAAMLLAAYLIGVSAFALKLAIERLAIRRLTRDAADVTDNEWTELAADCARDAGVSRPVRLLRSLDRTMPMAFGVLKPAIMIPSVADTWPHDRRRAVLLHELAHIARRDCLTQLITRIACALYWPHPGAWLIARRLRVARELACDDRVLSTGTAAPDYAQHLLELAYSLGGYRAPALVVSMARPQQLEGRMLAVLDHARNRTTPATRSRLAAFVIAGLVVAPLAAAEFSAVPDVSTFVAENGASVAPEPAPSPAPDQTPPNSPRRTREIQLPGTWSLRSAEKPNMVSLQLSERRNSMSGLELPVSELQGLSSSSLSGSGPVKFSLHREAGTINFEGSIRSGVGAGTFDFTPSPTFPGEMAKRGYERPTTDEMYVLARNDIGTAYLDELASQKYTRPSLDELLRAGDHGADLGYLRDMGHAGYHLGQIESLIRTRDHGVDMKFIDGLKSNGLSGLTADELVRARDHGVDPQYIGGMKQAGYDLHDLEGLVRARDHGVDVKYVQGMGAQGFHKLPIDDLIKARDHGVDADYVADMRQHGYDLAIHELINGRDHGVDEGFAGAFIALGYKDLTMDQLVRLRDHGVSASWAKRQNSDGRRLSVDELVRRRDRGGDN